MLSGLGRRPDPQPLGPPAPAHVDSLPPQPHRTEVDRPGAPHVVAGRMDHADGPRFRLSVSSLAPLKNHVCFLVLCIIFFSMRQWSCEHVSQCPTSTPPRAPSHARSHRWKDPRPSPGPSSQPEDPNSLTTNPLLPTTGPLAPKMANYGPLGQPAIHWGHRPPPS